MFAEVVPACFLRLAANTPLLQPVSLGFGAPRQGMMLRMEDARVAPRYRSEALEVMPGELRSVGF